MNLLRESAQFSTNEPTEPVIIRYARRSVNRIRCEINIIFSRKCSLVVDRTPLELSCEDGLPPKMQNPGRVVSCSCLNVVATVRHGAGLIRRAALGGRTRDRSRYSVAIMRHNYRVDNDVLWSPTRRCAAIFCRCGPIFVAPKLPFRCARTTFNHPCRANLRDRTTGRIILRNEHSVTQIPPVWTQR